MLLPVLFLILWRKQKIARYKLGNLEVQESPNSKIKKSQLNFFIVYSLAEMIFQIGSTWVNDDKMLGFDGVGVEFPCSSITGLTVYYYKCSWVHTVHVRESVFSLKENSKHWYLSFYQQILALECVIPVMTILLWLPEARVTFTI